ncbi:MAG: hypothetical protein B7Y26_05395 [Hydrogenophilales bacterium 16-64-46]|nr:MAG: hypothetical protein B7Z32_01225 [Hydrogenophilales bacterium 12-64-13]OYZ05761.1 MAG: hypothetical protein B7Y26_05395 [Hydrogenophilales bacterium 16-64-46]OZA39696.1 MAG: hypothetical protein B7X87_01420 [Hydrogenophilales bacterium 17-64-34]HQS98768.1 calcium-binding protein [Thiobacillus sp.]
MTGEGSVNLYDNQGHNSIVLGSGDSLEGASLALDADGTGYVVGLTNGRSLSAQNGFFGTAGTVQDANGAEVDLEGWAGTALTADLVLQLDDAGGMVYGGAGHDVLYGGAGSDTLSGHMGNDTLEGQGGNDTLNGGQGDDALNGGDGDDQLFGGEGRDVLDGGLGSDVLDGGAGDDVLRAGQGDPEGGFAKTLTGGEGNDTLIGLAWGSVDTASYAADPGAVVVELGRGYANDGWGGIDNLVDIDAATGSAFDDVLIGNGDANVLSGGEGNDVLDGVEGNDTMAGEAGVDSYLMRRGSGSDIIIEQAGESSILVLEGLALEDLRGELLGNDLLLTSSKAQDSVLIKDYTVLATDWRVQLADTEGDQSLADVLAANEAVLDALELTARLKQEFQDAWYAQETGDLLKQGWQETDEGEFVSGINLSVSYVESLDRGTVDLYATTTYVSGVGTLYSSPTGAANGASTMPLAPGFNGTATVSHTNSFQSAQFETVLIESNDEVIESSASGQLEIGQTTGNWAVTVDWYSRKIYQDQSTTNEFYGWIDSGYGYDFDVVSYTLEDETSIRLYGQVTSLEPTTDAASTLSGTELAQQTWYHQDPDNQFTLALTKTEVVISSSEILAGAGNNSIHAFAGDMVSAGAGDDIILDAAFNFYSIYSKALGFFADAGPGNDRIVGGVYDDIQIGGEGDDYLWGGIAGSDTFVMNASNNGQDVLVDDAVWQAGDEGVIWPGAAKDTVVFSEGVTFDDLSFSLGTILHADVLVTLDVPLMEPGYGSLVRDLGVLTTLDISWGEDSQVRIALDPGGWSSVEQLLRTQGNTNYDLDGSGQITRDSEFGIEQLEFADGTVVEIDALLSQLGLVAAQAYFYVESDNAVAYVQSLNTYQGVLDATGQTGLVIQRGSSGQLYGDNPRDVIFTGAGDTLVFVRNLNGTDLILQDEGRVNVMSTFLQRIGDDSSSSHQLEMARVGDDLQFRAINIGFGLTTGSAEFPDQGIEFFEVSETFEVFTIKGWFSQAATSAVYLNGSYELTSLVEQFAGQQGGVIADGASIRLAELDVTQAEIDWWSTGFLPAFTQGEGQDFNSLIGLSGPLENVFEFHAGMGDVGAVSVSDIDLLQFASSVDFNALTFTRSGDDLVISHGADALRITGSYLEDVEKPFVLLAEWEGATLDELNDFGVLRFGTDGDDNLMAATEHDWSLYGYEGNDALQGLAGSDYLDGGGGDDVLDGGAGSDYLFGGEGNDIHVVDNQSDTVLEYEDEGTDTVQSVVSFSLGGNLENLTLTGTSSINATGNSLANVLTGNMGNNILNGGEGADALIGGAGDDIYVVDNVGDVTTENAGEGTDAIEVGFSYSLADKANVENLTLTGTAAIDGTGNAAQNVITGNSAANKLSGGSGADTLTGGAGNDRLNGGAGNDTMLGGSGNDIYVVNVATDIVTEYINEGTDTVETGVTLTLAANVENLTLTGGSAINGTGNNLFNVLIGNGANNDLFGAAGDDKLDGLGGTDTLIGGTGNDTFRLGRGYGTDTVIENDTTAGNSDIAQFLSGVSAEQIWFQKVGNHLEASIIGTSDKLVIKDWYLGTAKHVEQFKTTDGALTLLDSQVDNLVNAMASFAPPAAGQTTLPQNYQDALAGVIAANWQ